MSASDHNLGVIRRSAVAAACARVSKASITRPSGGSPIDYGDACRSCSLF
jgi:hypothetical protein